MSLTSHQQSRVTFFFLPHSYGWHVYPQSFKTLSVFGKQCKRNNIRNIITIFFFFKQLKMYSSDYKVINIPIIFFLEITFEIKQFLSLSHLPYKKRLKKKSLVGFTFKYRFPLQDLTIKFLFSQKCKKKEVVILINLHFSLNLVNFFLHL